jgi:hypothetical protein
MKSVVPFPVLKNFQIPHIGVAPFPIVIWEPKLLLEERMRPAV